MPQTSHCCWKIHRSIFISSMVCIAIAKCVYSPITNHSHNTQYRYEWMHMTQCVFVQSGQCIYIKYSKRKHTHVHIHIYKYLYLVALYKYLFAYVYICIVCEMNEKRVASYKLPKANIIMRYYYYDNAVYMNWKKERNVCRFHNEWYKKKL